MICPVCEDGILEATTYTGILHGQEVFDLECYFCPACGADPVFPDQARRNHEKFNNVRLTMQDD